MKQLVSVSLALAVISVTVASANDCTFSDSVLTPYKYRNVSKLEWRKSREGFERLFVNCPAGPGDRSSRAVFFRLVDSVFNAGDDIGRGPGQYRSEAAWESASQYEYDLRQYMDRIVNEGDTEFKAVILKTSNGLAISRLGPTAKYDVLRVVHVADQTRIGAGHHSPYMQAIVALGYWIDPSEKRFTLDEKREMTDVLLEKTKNYGDTVDIEEVGIVQAILTALGHTDSPEALSTLRKWARSRNPSLREAAQSGLSAAKARVQQNER